MDTQKDKLLAKAERLNVYRHGPVAYLKKSVTALLFENWVNVLMICFPLAIHMEENHGDPSNIFFCSLLAIAPFAERLSFVTEQLALHTSEVLGGMLNATFGNVTELIVSLFALKYGMLRIVQCSLLGSILSNLMLVLGCAFFAGGIVTKQQKFSAPASSVNYSLLVLGASSSLLPCAIDANPSEGAPPGSGLVVSRVLSCMMLVVYVCYVTFQLVTHTFLYEDDDDDDEEAGEGEEEEEEEAVLGVAGSVFWLAVITVVISILSEYMVDSLEAAAVGWGVPDLFLGTIIIPIVGNAAEHAAAIIFAVKNKMELALGIAVGSSIQIGVFCVPLLCVFAWSIDIELSLNFGVFECLTYLITALVVGAIITSGQSNWLQGVVLITGYAFVSAAFFVHADPPELASHAEHHHE
mmetsp:Transcript_33023/g.103758  ORF Transcript_33023/g.103758 Transcript_33023/m.103758 type:complete len:410 (-) Transcript_33023:339-1568(-)